MNGVASIFLIISDAFLELDWAESVKPECRKTSAQSQHNIPFITYRERWAAFVRLSYGCFIFSLPLTHPLIEKSYKKKR